MTGGAVTVERVPPEALGAADREGWQRLADTVEDATVFMGPAALGAWRRTIGAAVETEVLLARRGGAVVGVLPVMRSRVRRGPAFVPRIDYGAFDADLSGPRRRPFPVRQLSSIVSWRATSLRPTLLCAPRDRDGVARAMATALARVRDVDQIALPVREGEEAPWLEGFQAAGLDPWLHALGRSVLTLERVRPVEAIVAEQNGKFRQNVRRARAAAAAAGLSFRVLRGADEVGPRLGLVAEIAAESWKGSGDTPDRLAIPYGGAQRRYIEALLDGSGAGVEPVLCLGETAEGVVVVVLCCRHGPTLATLLTFRRDVLGSASPGLLAILAVIDWSAAEGVGRVDLNATQDWVRHFSDSTHRIVNVLAFRPTLRGRAYGAIARWRRGQGPSPAG